MENRVIEFGISEIRRHCPTQVSVIGRCHQGPIHIGDVFKSVYQIIIVRTANGYDTSIRSNAKPVSLRVNSIRAYEHDLEWIDTGLTGELELSGEGIDSFKEADVLGDEQSP